MSSETNAESDMEYSEDDCSYEDYYNSVDDCDSEQVDFKKVDPEHHMLDCLSVEEVERLLNESVEALCNELEVVPSLAKVLLHTHEWAVGRVISQFRSNSSQLLISSCVKPAIPPVQHQENLTYMTCPVCIATHPREKFCSLACGHMFCKDCWAMHFEVQISLGVSTGIACMAQDCGVLTPEDFVLSLAPRPQLREKYQMFCFRDYVKSHPHLRFCPGLNCNVVMLSKELKAKKAFCTQCKTMFCFNCSLDYHAPSDCNTIKRWLTKCADDSETANYISAHTKDCPKCHVCIEKNGGCNHMQCRNCKHNFCWMCLGDWKAHGAEYYECSRYKENPNIANESAHAQAREALKKYLHYYERWENHSKSLKLEEQTVQQIKYRINEKVMTCSGTWIDWQYLMDAAALLAKCRYTLQYTYPYAYYLEPGPRKELVQRPCEDVFRGPCFWKKKKIECCNIFELQKTEFGFCYSFNSDVSEWSKTRSRVKNVSDKFWIDERTDSLRPRRTSTYGKFSGLHVTVNTPLQSEMPPGLPDAKPGVKVRRILK